MKFKLSKDEILNIVTQHVNTLGFATSKAEIIYKDEKDYEYFGDPTRQDRKEICVRKLDGIEIEVKLSQ